MEIIVRGEWGKDYPEELCTKEGIKKIEKEIREKYGLKENDKVILQIL